MTDNTTQKKPAGSNDDVLPVISDARDRRLNTLRQLRDFADETAGSGDELVGEAFARLPDVTADEVRELTRDFGNKIERLQSVVEIIDEAAPHNGADGPYAPDAHGGGSTGWRGGRRFP